MVDISESIQWQEYKTNLLYKRDIDIDSRVINIFGEINENTFRNFDKALTILENISNEDPITIRINTYGGDIYETFAIIDRAAKTTCGLITEGYGKVMSAGIYLLTIGDERKISKHTSLMVHHFNYGLPRLSAAAIKNEVKHSDALEKKMYTYLAKKTKMPYTHWAATGKLLDTFIEPETAVEWGIVDSILDDYTDGI